jgi:sugar lactone lactonase YvrE
MNHSISCSRLRGARFLFAAALAALLAACGGDDDAAPADAAPTIAQQPADTTVAAGQPASFSVVANGAGPLAFQWQRGGADIAGATAAMYAVAAASAGDGGAVFQVVVSNAAGAVTSAAATLTVTIAAPVLTVTQQPAGSSVVAGATATFNVAATCSSGALAIQWQRSSGAAAFADVVGATAATFAFATALADSGAQFRAALNCSAQSATASAAALLTVTSPSAVTSTAQPIVAADGQADISQSPLGIVQEPSGSFLFGAGAAIKRLSGDLGKITQVAGGQSQGFADGPAASATFKNPQSLVQDSAGNIFVADGGNHSIRRIATDGTVSTLAGGGGAGTPGFADGTGSAARFNTPTGIALGSDGDLYVSDTLNERIRRVTTAGVVTTYAGSTQGFGDGPALAAQFHAPNAVAVAANGDLLVSDSGNSRIRHILRAGNGAGLVETLAGSGTSIGTSADGIGTAAEIIGPSGLSLQGNALSVLDGAGLLRQVDITTRAVTTLTGSRTLGAGYADGTPTSARLNGFGALTRVASGGFLLTDGAALRFVSAAGNVRTLATNAAFGITAAGTGVLAQMPLALFTMNNGAQPVSLAVDPAGKLVVGESAGQDVRRIDATGAVTLIAGLTGTHASVDGIGSEAQFRNVGPLAATASGVIYVGDLHCVRRIGTDNATTFLAGSCTAFTAAVDGSAASARFGTVNGLAVGPNGDVFVADATSNAIRRIDAAGNVTTYMGVLGQAGTADGSVATARLKFPSSVAFAADGALIVADFGSLRRIAPDGSSITTLMPTPISLASAGYIAVDADGTIYFGGSNNNLLAEGLYKLPPGASSPTLLIPYSQNGPVLGSAPTARVDAIDALTLVGPKQLVLVSRGQIIKVSLP